MYQELSSPETSVGKSTHQGLHGDPSFNTAHACNSYYDSFHYNPDSFLTSNIYNSCSTIRAVPYMMHQPCNISVLWPLPYTNYQTKFGHRLSTRHFEAVPYNWDNVYKHTPLNLRIAACQLEALNGNAYSQYYKWIHSETFPSHTQYINEDTPKRWQPNTTGELRNWTRHEKSKRMVCSNMVMRWVSPRRIENGEQTMVFNTQNDLDNGESDISHSVALSSCSAQCDKDLSTGKETYSTRTVVQNPNGRSNGVSVVSGKPQISTSECNESAKNEMSYTLVRSRSIGSKTRNPSRLRSIVECNANKKPLTPVSEQLASDASTTPGSVFLDCAEKMLPTFALTSNVETAPIIRNQTETPVFSKPLKLPLIIKPDREESEWHLIISRKKGKHLYKAKTDTDSPIRDCGLKCASRYDALRVRKKLRKRKKGKKTKVDIIKEDDYELQRQSSPKRRRCVCNVLRDYILAGFSLWKNKQS